MAGLDERIDQVTDDSLAATERIVKTAVETEELSVHTSEKLQRQGEQLIKIRGGTETIKEDLREAERDISKLERLSSWCCCLCCIGRPCRRRRKKIPVAETRGDGAREPAVSATSGSKPPEGPFIKMVTGDSREVKMEENLRKTSDIVVGLKQQAVAQGEMITQQNELIDDTAKSAEEAVEQLEDDTKRMNRI